VSTDESHIDCLTTGRNTPDFTLSAATIGLKAVDILSQAKTFIIRGVTSRGVFVAVDDKVILFLSKERFKGPLIVNLPWDPVVLDQIAIQAEGRVCSRGLRFSSPNLFIDISRAEAWSACSQWNSSPLPGSMPTNQQISAFLRMLQSRAESPNEMVAAALRVIQTDNLPQRPESDETIQHLSQAYLSLQTGDMPALQSVAHFLAGRGRGLTPSGDDFLLGLVYGLFMLPNQFQSIREIASAAIVDQVRTRSTLISANLVECAAMGEVDERLGAAFQTLLHPDSPSDTAIHGILGWGSSSGMDASAGMAVLIAAANENID